VPIEVQTALVAVGSLGERIRSNTLLTYCAVAKEESLRNRGFTIPQPISEAVSHNTNDKKQEQQKLKMMAMNAGINVANRRLSSLRAWKNNGYRRPYLFLCVTQLFRNNLQRKKNTRPLLGYLNPDLQHTSADTKWIQNTQPTEWNTKPTFLEQA